MPIYVINLAGALNALIVAVLLLLLPRLRSSLSIRYLSGLLGISAIVVSLITLEHAGIIWPRPLIARIEESLSLLVGPLLLGYLLVLLGHGKGRWWLFLPWALHLLASLLLPSPLTGWMEMSIFMWIQMLYTLAGFMVYFVDSRHPGHRRLPRHVLVILGVFAGIHIAQVSRFAFSDIEALRDIVPWTASAAFFALFIYALLQSRAFTVLASQPAGPDRQAWACRIVERLDTRLRETQAWRDSSLTMEKLALELGIPVGNLSRAVNQQLGVSFPDYLNGFRVAEAKRLLRDPQEQRFTVEGLGRQAGFGSRSAFYRIFRQHTGMSPAGYREHHRR